MPTTKEDLLKLLTDNYEEVQKLELNVYDEHKKLEKEFKQSEKKLSKNLNDELKTQDLKSKEVVTLHKGIIASLNDKNNAIKDAVTAKKEEIEKIYKESLQAAEDKKETAITKVKAELKSAKSEYTKHTNKTKKEYDESIAKSEKEIVKINEKAVKDQNVLDQMIEDVKLKHDTKNNEINEKEQVKIQKLTEASNKNISKLETTYNKKKSELDQQIADMRALYEEELEEIEEDISTFKAEFDGKIENVKSSSEQRIAVREKHRQRAIQDNDQRSAKQHKKDIDRFKKEAERDLVLIRKNYDQEGRKKSDYRKTFIQENFEKFAKYEKASFETLEELQLQVDNMKLQLTHDLKNTQLEFEKLRVEERYHYQTQMNDLLNKKAEAATDKDVSLEKQRELQASLLINLNTTNGVNALRQDELVESKEKELRDIEIEKSKDDFLAKDVLDKEISTQTYIEQTAGLELVKDLDVNELNEEVDHLKIKQAKLASHSSELLSYEELYKPLFTSRANKWKEYEELETNNYYRIKFQFIDTHKKEIERDYHSLVSKIDQALELERVEYDKHIAALAGEESEELENFKAEGLEKIYQLKEEIKALHPKRDRKKLKPMQQQLDNYEASFNQELAEKNREVNDKVKVYKEALNQALSRHEESLASAKVFYESELAGINAEYDLLLTSKQKELEKIKSRKLSTEEGLQSFMNVATSLNHTAKSDYQTYTNTRIEAVQNRIDARNSLYETDKHNLDNDYQSEQTGYENTKQENVRSAEQQFRDQETNLEQFKSNIQNQIDNLQSKKSTDLNDEASKSRQILDEFNQEMITEQGKNNQVFETQTNEYNQALDNNTQSVLAETQHYESELKRIKQDSETKIKSEQQRIEGKLSDDIKKI